MIYLSEIFYNTFASAYFLLTAIIISFSVKSYFLSILIPQGLRSPKIEKPWFFLLGILAGSMFGDVAWMVKLLREIWFHSWNYVVVTFFIRIAWAFLIIQYQSLALFIESLTEKNFKLGLVHKLLLLISGSFTLYFFWTALFDTSLTSEVEREYAKTMVANIPLELNVMRYTSYYLFNLLLLPSMYITFKNLRSNTLPNILKTQLSIFIQFLICPYILVEIIQAAHFIFKSLESHQYLIISLSTILLTYAIYYCMKSVLGLRFFNFASHVQDKHKITFIDEFKNVFEQLSSIKSPQELNHIIQTFFKDTFNIPSRKTTIYIRNLEKNSNEIKQTGASPGLNIESRADHFFNNHNDHVCNFINKHKILIYDEIAFTNFYEEDSTKKEIVEFLQLINCDILLPIYEKQKIVAYIIVERNSRQSEFFSENERSQMLVFASYLANVLNLLKNNNLESMVHQEKELKEELYNTQQEMSQYKESIRSFIRNTRQKEIGIIFYKNRRFVFGNQAAKEIVKININNQEGHPLTQALKQIARQVEEYKSTQTSFVKDNNGNKLVLCGVPNLEQSNVIITIYYPEISDIITKQIVLLKDPTKWDYLLYLETTQAGQLINQLMPGSGEVLLHFKIHLLKIALSKKTTLLEVPEDDLIPVVELLHHISGRETLHTMKLTSSERNYEAAIKLFGSANATNASTSLLKKLDHRGTLFIENIEMLSMETQNYLADYITYGTFLPLKSEQKFISNVRIICSSNHNLQTLVHDGSFSSALFSVINKTVITLPTLSKLPDQELHELIDGFTEQAIKTQAFKTLLELTDKEKIKLMLKAPDSLQELKNKVQNALVLKSKKNHIFNETEFDPAYSITDPELTEAARLGKHALRDSKIMGILWNKFKNQNQIATFLGVNRSSVNRRCKDYNLQ